MKIKYVTQNDQNSSQYKNKKELYLGVNILNDLQKPEIQANSSALDYFFDRCFDFFSRAIIKYATGTILLILYYRNYIITLHYIIYCQKKSHFVG
jgi:hypothetical protein